MNIADWITFFKGQPDLWAIAQKAVVADVATAHQNVWIFGFLDLIAIALVGYFVYKAIRKDDDWWFGVLFGSIFLVLPLTVATIGHYQWAVRATTNPDYYAFLWLLARLGDVIRTTTGAG